MRLPSCRQGLLCVGTDVFAIVHARKLNLLGGVIGTVQSSFERRANRSNAKNAATGSEKRVFVQLGPSVEYLDTGYMLNTS